MIHCIRRSDLYSCESLIRRSIYLSERLGNDHGLSIIYNFRRTPPPPRRVVQLGHNILMSSTAATPTAATGTAVAIPSVIVDGILASLKEPLRDASAIILVVTAFGAILIPILIALFYFSTPSSRREVIFILNVASILVGIGVAMWMNYSLVRITRVAAFACYEIGLII